MTAFYNEIDPYAAQWLRNLIAAGHIALGVVDERSIVEIKPEELRGYTQCHFFAGVGVWSFALRNAGWPDDRPVWTGSCPCQPFSAAGAGAGFADERHLWPTFHHLIAECRPPIVLGEQVASKAVDPWIDLVHADLEALGYAFGSVPFPSAGVGAPHIRDRNYWCGTLAYAHDARLEGRRLSAKRAAECFARTGGVAGGLADSTDQRQHGWRAGEAGNGRDSARVEPQRLCDAVGLADDELQQRSRSSAGGDVPRGRQQEPAAPAGLCSDLRPGPTNGFWRDTDWLGCRDGKWRPVEPGTFPLAHGAASRLVCTCSHCETETVIYENVQILRKVADRYKGLSAQDILQRRMLQAMAVGLSPSEHQFGALPRAESRLNESVREMRADGQSARTPRKPERAGRLASELGAAMRDLPPCGTQEAAAAFAVRELWGAVCSGVTPEREQNLFCPVCEAMGAHLCETEVGGSRVGRLRGYGNAINAEAARVWIETVMECLP